MEWPRPCSLTGLRGFLRLTGFYRRFVRGYAMLAAPLTDLLRYNKLQWNTTAESAFTAMKTKMTTMPVLQLSDFSKVFLIKTDASGVAIGAVLSQGGHPLAYFSKKLNPKLELASAYVREMYDVTESVKKWRQYLIGQQFQIFTDRRSLKDLLLQKIQTLEQQKWASKLQGFNFEIFYKPGKHNQAANALSRQLSDNNMLLLTLSSPVPDLLQQFQQYLASTGKEMTQKLLSSDSAQQYYKFHNGLLYYKNRLFVPNFAEWRKKLLTEYHCTPMVGHSSVEPTVARLAASFYWPGLYTATKSFVNHCDTCQLNKNLTQKKLGLLQALPIPSQVWDELTTDFVTHLPNSYNHTVIWVICDRLTKFVHFIALPTKFTTEHLAQDFSVESAEYMAFQSQLFQIETLCSITNFGQHYSRHKGLN